MKIAATKKKNYPSACFGDSGGPAYVQFSSGRENTMVVGLTQGAHPEAAMSQSPCEYGLALFTPISPYFSWIEEVSGRDLKAL